MTTETQTLPELPTGYSWRDYNNRKVVFYICVVKSVYGLRRALGTFSHYNVSDYLRRDGDSVLHWKDVTKLDLPDEIPGTMVAVVADSEIPEGGMQFHTTHFNETTGKYEPRQIETDIHAHHERNHDSDVASAVAALCTTEIDIMHRKAVLENLNPDQQARARAHYTDFDDCIDDVVDANAEPALERAYIKSLGDIRHTDARKTSDEEALPIVTAAHDFATEWLAHLNSRTRTQLGARRYEYNLCVFRQLLADRDKASNRFLPKGVKIVKRKSTPAKAEEKTAAQVFAAVKALVSPAEGAPKRA